jgi:hypothetical protein
MCLGQVMVIWGVVKLWRARGCVGLGLMGRCRGQGLPCYAADSGFRVQGVDNGLVGARVLCWFRVQRSGLMQGSGFVN